MKVRYESTRTYVCTHTDIQKQKYIKACIDMHMPTYIHTCIHANIPTYIINTCMQTYIPLLIPPNDTTFSRPDDALTKVP